MCIKTAIKIINPGINAIYKINHSKRSDSSPIYRMDGDLQKTQGGENKICEETWKYLDIAVSPERKQPVKSGFSNN